MYPGFVSGCWNKLASIAWCLVRDWGFPQLGIAWQSVLKDQQRSAFGGRIGLNTENRQEEAQGWTAAARG